MVEPYTASDAVPQTASLSATEIELRTILEAMTELILVMDCQGRCLKIVSTNAALLHKPVDQLIGKTLPEIYDPDQAHIFEGYIQKTLSTQKPVRFEYCVTIEEQEVWLAASTSPLSPQTLVWVARDITERKRASEQLQLLLTITTEISDAADFSTALEVALRHICEVTGWIYGEAWIPAADGTALECSPAWYCRGFSPESPDRDSGVFPEIQQFREYSEGLTLLPGEELPGQVWEQGQPIWMSDIGNQPDDIFLRTEFTEGCGFKAAFGIPIIATDGDSPDSNFGDGYLPPPHTDTHVNTQVLAVLVFFIQKARQQDQRLVQLISAIATQLGTAIQHKQTEAQLKALFAAMNDVIMVLDSQGCYQKIAPTNTALLYKPPEELIGRTLRDVFDRELADKFLSYIWQALNTKKTVNIEYSFTIDNKDIWFSGSISPLSEDAVIWIARDITDRKQAQDYLRLILDNIPQQVFWKDTNLVLMGCNKNWAEAAGFSDPEAAVGLTDYDLFPQEVAEAVRLQDREIMKADRPELHIISAQENPEEEGETLWLDINKVPIHNTNGKVIGILGVMEDITARKLAEDALILEQQKSERLLLNILPQAIAEQLKQDTSAFAEDFEQVTILFADIVGFTPLSARLSAAELVNLLNTIFSAFDQLARHYGVEKIKTIGDAYMVAAGLPVPRPDHAAAIADMALEMQKQMGHFQDILKESLQIRIGIHTGPVVAGVIGIQKFIYDLWGDTVNVASRMESSGEAAKIQVTPETYQQLQDQYVFQYRGEIPVKGKGDMKTYWLIDKKN